MRQSNDELDKDGTVLNGFDYRLQVWVTDGIVDDQVGEGKYYGAVLGKELTGHEVRGVQS